MLNLLCSFLRQGVLQELPVVRLNPLWPYKNLWTELEPTHSLLGHHRQVSGSHVQFPITLKPLNWASQFTCFLLQKINEKSLTLQPVCNISIMLYCWFHDISNGIDLRWKAVMLGFIFMHGFANNSQFDKVYIPVAVVPCSVCNETPWVGLQTRISHLVRVVNNGWTLNSVCPLWKGVCFLWGLVGVLMMPSFLYLFHESDWICLEGGNEREREWKRGKRAREGLGNAARHIR